MRFGSRLHPAVIAMGALALLLAGCSEEKPADADTTLPRVAILQPLSSERLGFEVQDSTVVVVEASDNESVSKVEIFYHALGDTTTNPITTITEPDSAGDYRVTWNTAGIQNGIQCVLRATAEDPSGNIGASEPVLVQIVNTEGIRRPYANFSITPSEGTILTHFCFDPSLTWDELADNVDLFVQWDFQNDGVWDHTLAEHLTATTNDIVCHDYQVPDTYTVVLEVYNQYYSIPLGIPDVKRLSLVVKPAYGDPRPPLGEEFVKIDPGDYYLGALECTPGQGCDIFDEDEAVSDTLVVRLSTQYYIDKYEVTNKLYIDYLNAAIDSGFVKYDFVAGDIRRTTDDKLLLTLDDNLTRVKFQFADSSFWAAETYLEHPVTGVTWYGAYDYASFYGLRLPTEAEWEAAARVQHVTTTYSYPWADDGVIDNTYANYFNSDDPYEDDAIATTPVGSYTEGGYLGGISTKNAVSPKGTYDQAGNVAEWCADWFDAATYDELVSQPIKPIDPQGPTTGTAKVIRGGSWSQYPHELRVTYRQAADPRLGAGWLGFRTAYTVY